MKKFQGVFIKNSREIENLRDADRLTAQGEAAPEAPAEPYTGGLDEAQRQALLYGGD